MATTNDTEPRYADNMLDDTIWSELPVEDQRRLVSELRSKTLHALSMVNAEISDAKNATTRMPRQDFSNLLRKRARTMTFLELVNERARRMKASTTHQNISQDQSETKRRYRHLRTLVEMHRTINEDPESTDVELEAADRRLYAALDAPTDRKEEE